MIIEKYQTHQFNREAVTLIIATNLLTCKHQPGGDVIPP